MRHRHKVGKRKQSKTELIVPGYEAGFCAALIFLNQSEVVPVLRLCCQQTTKQLRNITMNCVIMSFQYIPNLDFFCWSNSQDLKPVSVSAPKLNQRRCPSVQRKVSFHGNLPHACCNIVAPWASDHQCPICSHQCGFVRGKDTTVTQHGSWILPHGSIWILSQCGRILPHGLPHQLSIKLRRG